MGSVGLAKAPQSATIQWKDGPSRPRTRVLDSQPPSYMNLTAIDFSGGEGD